MTKIDESKQYKFSEIIAMLENKELPVGTEVFMSDQFYPDVYTVESGINVSYGLSKYRNCSLVAGETSSLNISNLWNVRLPKEDKFYLKAPSCFVYGGFLNYSKNANKYFLAGGNTGFNVQTQFAQKEIDSMPFDIKFFEKVKAEQADE